MEIATRKEVGVVVTKNPVPEDPCLEGFNPLSYILFFRFCPVFVVFGKRVSSWFDDLEFDSANLGNKLHIAIEQHKPKGGSAFAPDQEMPCHFVLLPRKAFGRGLHETTCRIVVITLFYANWSHPEAIHEVRNGEDRRIAVLGLNSAWLSMSDEDEILKLVIGERQTRAALKAAKETSTTLNIALLHHPLEWIRPFDRSDSGERLRNNCDFILHGHLHEPGMVHLSDPDGDVTIIPGGACYDNRKYPNSYNFVRINFESGTGKIYFREYVDRQGGYWAKGVRLYKNVEDGVYEFSL